MPVKPQLRLNGKLIYTLEELRKNFNSNELAVAYNDGSLICWLEFFFYTKIADKVRSIDPDKNLIEQLKQILLENHENRPPKFKRTEEPHEEFEHWSAVLKTDAELKQKGDEHYSAKNYLQATKNYLDAYLLGNDEVYDNLFKSLKALLSEKQPSEEKFFVSRKFFASLAIIFALSTVVLAYSLFNTLNEVDELKSNRAKIGNELADYKNENSVLRRRIDEFESKITNIETLNGVLNGIINEKHSTR